MPSPHRAYASPAYALSLGQPLWPLVASGGFLQIRTVPGSTARDLAGLHPVLSVAHPEALPDDLHALRAPWLSATLVPDPLQPFDAVALSRWADVTRPLGDHLLIALAHDTPGPSAHHRRQIRRAARQPHIDIRLEASPAGFAATWATLYAHLSDKVNRRSAPSSPWLDATALADGLALPGSVVVSAWQGDEPLGADWYLQDGANLRAHLSAYSPRGYALAVSYLLLDQAIQLFRGQFEHIDLGGVPHTQQGSEGLAQFKQGWANLRRPRHLYGKMLNVAPGAGPAGTVLPTEHYFPPYRAPSPQPTP